MLSKFLHILCTCLLCCGVATAQVPADSIDRAAQDEDFVRASLLVIGPGDNVVTCFGHAAIRMQCPTHQLDYCFTFEMKLAEGEHTKFLTGQAKAGFMAAPTGVFMEQYKRQGRSINEYDLNLTPKQEQTLWRNLDREIAQEARWSYDFITVNCGSMCVWIIQQSLLDEHIEYQQLPTVLQGTYSDVMDYVGEDAPWLNLYFHVRYFSRRNDTGALADKMAPTLLAEAWQHALLTSPTGGSRPVITASRQLAPQTLRTGPVWLTPAKALVIAIIIIIVFIFIKTKFMKRLFTSNKRLVLTAALALSTAFTAMAGGDDWYAFNVQIDAYPTGAGVVYADENEMEAFAPAEDAVFKESINVQYTSTTSMLNAFAQANDGWYLLGFAKDTLDTEGNVHHVDEITYKIGEMGYAMLSLDGVSSKHWDDESQSEVSDDSLTVAGLMPLEPNNYFRAIFTHAYATVAPGYEYLAKVTVDKLANNIGDKVTFTATPLSDFTTFVNWTKDGEVVSTSPIMEVTVGGIEEYVANFTDSRNITLNFPEEGGYIPFFSEYSYGLVGTEVYAYAPAIYDDMENNCLVDMVIEEGQRASYLNMIGGNYQTGGMTAQLLYGYGNVTLVPNDTVAAEEPWNTQVFRWTDESGLAVGGLNQSMDKYYAYDQANLKFDLITDGSIAANSLYMVMPDSLMAEGQPAPAVIYVDENAYINGVTGIRVPAANNAAKQKTYDLQGRRIDAINREGLYIFDGKKVIYRKK